MIVMMMMMMMMMIIIIIIIRQRGLRWLIRQSWEGLRQSASLSEPGKEIGRGSNTCLSEPAKGNNKPGGHVYTDTAQ